MKIVIITNKFPTQVCGVGDYSYYLSEELTRRGHQIYIICNQSVVPMDDEQQLKIYPIIPKWTAANYQKVLEKIAIIQPDWVLFQYVPYAFHRLGMPVGIVKLIRQIKQKNIRVLVFFHEVFIGFASKSAKAIVVALVQAWIAKKICQSADSVATSIDYYVGLLKKWRQDIYQIPIGSNIPFDKMSEPTKELDRPFKIITFGVRHIDKLLHFFPIIKAAIPSVHLIICGKQNLSSEQKIDQDIHFTGYLPANEIAQLLRSADVFILADFVSTDGMGGTCLKSGSLAAAFGAGLPIIGMEGRMNDRLLKKLKPFDLVDYHDYESWTTAVLKIYNNQIQRTEKQTANLAFYEKYLSWKQIANQYLELMH